MKRLRREKAIMRNSSVIISLGFECLYRKYMLSKWGMQGEIPIFEREIPMGVSCLNSFLEVATDFLSHFIGESVSEFWEDMLIDDGPHEFVI